MPESRFHIPLFVVLIACGASVLLSSCGTGPEPPELSEIARVEITPEPVTTHYTAVFTLVVGDSLTEPYQVAWQLARPDGSALDTLTDTKRFYWTAPSQLGEYTHSVRLKTEDGKPLSEEYSFAVEVVPWDPPPADSALSGKIVFSARDTTNELQIFTMKADGTDLQQLTEWTSPSTSPSWSPDGEQIVFSSFHGANNVSFPALWVMNADGTNARLVQEGDRLPLQGLNPQWSPDGRKIVYEYCPGCEAGSNNYDIYVYDFETGETTQITENSATDLDAQWSPDGNRIVFKSRRGHENYKFDLYIINSDGTGLLEITDLGYAHLPAWNPNGKAIAFYSSENPKDLYLASIDSKIITTIKDNISDDLYLYPYAWSRDGHNLLIGGRTTDSPRNHTLFTLNKETGKAKYIYSVSSKNSNPALMGADWFISKP